MSKDLEIALRIKADLSQASQEMKQLSTDMQQTGSAAEALNTDLNATANAATAIANDLTDLQRQTKNLGQSFVHAGQSSFSFRNSVKGATGEMKQLSTDMQQTGSAAEALNTDLNATANAATAIVNDLADLQRQTKSLGQSFVYAGQSSFSFRNSVKGATLSAEEQARELSRLVSTYDSLFIEARKLANEEALLNKAFAQGKISAEQYNRIAAVMVQRNQRLAGSYNHVRGVAQNFGWQLQDIAVQMQAGVSPAVILSQQGSQLVSAFNPLAGAAIAVGGALAGALLPALFSNSDAAEELNQQIRDLYKNYSDLGDAQRQQLINAESTKQAKFIEEIARQKIEIDKLAESYRDLKTVQGTSSFVDRIATGGQFENAATTKDLASAEGELTTARATLETKNRELADSEKELRRLRGEIVVDEEEINNKAKELLENLKEQTATYKLQGEELGVYITKKIGVVGKLREEIIEQYKLIEAQQKAAKIEAEAKAADEKKQREIEAKIKSNEDYVRSLELQAATISLTTKELNDRQNAERGLTGAMLERAEAAQKINAQAKEAKVLEALELQLLKAKGAELDSARAEMKQRYAGILNDLEVTSRERGQQIIGELINLEELQLKLKEAEQAIDKALSDQQRQESSINSQREAGLITEVEARRRIVELHQETYDLLEQQRPVLEKLREAEGVIGESATRTLETLNSQAELLLTTVSLLESTLRGSLETGLSDALQGLAKGTYTLREAIHSLATTVSDALLKLAADELAQRAVGSLFGGGKDNMSDGAAKTSAAAGLLNQAAATWAIVANQIKAAAASLAASGAASGASGAGGGGSEAGGYAGLIQLGASLFAADGGEVIGPGTTTSDSIPAMLSNKEFVTRAAVMMQPGALDFQHDFNRRGMAALADWAPAFHNTGGLAGVPAPAMPSPTLGSAKLPEPSKAFSATLKNSQNFILVDDPSRMSEYLKTPEGEESVFVMLKRNPGKFGSVLKVGGNR